MFIADGHLVASDFTSVFVRQQTSTGHHGDFTNIVDIHKHLRGIPVTVDVSKFRWCL